MPHSHIGTHHFQIRKRLDKNLKKDSFNKWENFFDGFIYFIAVFGPIMTLPQIYKIWIEQNAIGVSAITWSAYIVSSAFWFIYGVAHKDKPIIFTQIIWIVLDIIIVIGTLIYA